MNAKELSYVFSGPQGHRYQQDSWELLPAASKLQIYQQQRCLWGNTNTVLPAHFSCFLPPSSRRGDAGLVASQGLCQCLSCTELAYPKLSGLAPPGLHCTKGVGNIRKPNQRRDKAMRSQSQSGICFMGLQLSTWVLLSFSFSVSRFDCSITQIKESSNPIASVVSCLQPFLSLILVFTIYPTYFIWSNFQKEKERCPGLLSRHLQRHREERGGLATRLTVYGPEKGISCPPLSFSRLVSLYLFICLTKMLFHSKKSRNIH